MQIRKVLSFFLFCSPAVFVGNTMAQTQLIKAATATESAVLVTMQWLASIKPISGQLYTITEELKGQVKKMGGFCQLLIQVIEHTVVNVTKLMALHNKHFRLLG